MSERILRKLKADRGSYLLGNEGYGVTLIKILAHDGDAVFAKELYPQNKTACLWNLEHRDWRRVWFNSNKSPPFEEIECENQE